MGIRAELQWRKFGLDYDKPFKFVRSQWGHSKLYSLWRLFWAAFHTAWIATSLALTSGTSATSSDKGKWFIYLSNWTYLMLTVETWLEAAVLVFVTTKRKDILSGKTNTMPWYLKVQWLLYTIVTSGSFHISAFYWLIIFKDQQLTPVRLAVHGFNSFYVFLNILVTATPVRLLHFVYPVAFGTLYTVFTVAYFAADGTNLAGEPYIYRILKWDRLRLTLPIVFVSTFVVLPCEHCFVFLLCKLRTFCDNRRRSRRRQEEESKPFDSNWNGHTQLALRQGEED